MTDENYLERNLALWDERVPIHVGSRFYDVPGFQAGREALQPFEIAEMGDVSGRSLVHLQCHFGLDVLSWARHGAQVTGLDFSGPAVEAARQIAADCGLAARFVQADVYDAVEALGETYDIVYTGLGAINWLPDIDRWAQVVSALLKPGGFLYLAEFHPYGDVLDDDEGMTVTYEYFDVGPHVWDEPGTYTDGGEHTENTISVEFRHAIGDVVTALATAGLRIEFLHEHDYTLYPRFRNLEQHGGEFRTPPGRPRVPLMYSLRASN